MGCSTRDVPAVVDARALGLAGIALGYRGMRGQAKMAGALYRFVLCFMFTLLGYGGAAPLVRRVPFFTVLGLDAR